MHTSHSLISFPSTLDQTPWFSALLSLLPFVAAGSLRIMVSFQPGWSPKEGSLLYSVYLLLCTLALTSGLVLGAVKKSPRWLYPYPVLLAFSSYILRLYLGYLLPVKINLQSSFFLSLLIILIFLWLPPFHAFYQNIRQDWTLASYGLYGLVLYLFSAVDFDQTPKLNWLVLLPSILAICAALAHLRIRSAHGRIAALLMGTYTGLFFWLIPSYMGMITVWLRVGMGVFLLLVYGITLTVILLSPGLVMLVSRVWRGSQEYSKRNNPPR